MFRLLMVAALCVAMNSGFAEARGRQRMMRSQSTVRWSTPVRYSSNVVRPATSVSALPSSSTIASSSSATSPAANGSIQQVSANGPDAATGGVTTASASTTVVETAPAVSVHPMQQWAEDEARMMAERGTCGHIRGAPAGYFVGVGCGRTCMGSGRLVAEAHYGGKSVRVWQR